MAAGHAVRDMEWFPATDEPPCSYDIRKVGECDVYIGILGLLYGQPVRENPSISYTQQEFLAAGEKGIPRLIFVLNSESQQSGLPIGLLRDAPYLERQQAFVASVTGERIVKFFDSAGDLGLLVERSLRDLKEEVIALGASVPAAATAVGGVPQRSARPVPELLPYLPDRDLQKEAMSEALQRLQAADRPRPLLVILHGEEDQRPDRFFDCYFESIVEKQFDRSLPIRQCHLPWPSELVPGETFARQFQQKISHYLRLGSGEEMAGPDAPRQGAAGTLVLWSLLDSEAWGQGGGQLVQEIDRFWQECELFAGQPLIHWIRIRYRKPPAYERRNLVLHWFWDLWRHRRRCRRLQRRNDEIRRSVDALDAASASPASALVLPELKSVGWSEVEGWLRSEDVRTFLNDQGRLPLEDAVQSFYRDWERKRGAPHIPMEHLASFLHQQLARAASSP